MRCGLRKAIVISCVSLMPHPTLGPGRIGRPPLAVSPTLRSVGSTVLAGLSLRLVRYEIAEESMVPALWPGDRVLGVRRPQRLRTGDVVVFELRPGFEVVKRVSPPPAGTHGLWLLGDNPAGGSVDSRTLGPVDPRSVRARLLLRYRPRPIRPVA
jgi:hypothetical protein